jgi:hypothetical protein
MLAALCIPLSAREPAQVRLFCLSLWFPPAQTTIFGQTYTLELTTATGLAEINNELGPLFDNRLPTHGSFFRLHDPGFPFPLTGQIAFDLPQFTDDNENGFDDFFESAQGVETSTTFGLFTTAVDRGNVIATWTRLPGSATGACRLQLIGDAFGQLPEFTHDFELLEYSGTLSYIPATNAITGTLELERTGNSTGSLSGNVRLTREPANPLNQAHFQGGSLTNSAGQEFRYVPSRIDRDQDLGTLYIGWFEFADGDPSTSAADYLDWFISIEDSNDSNGNGIPDLTDDPPAGPLDPPAIQLNRSGNQLVLSIVGAVGRTFYLEEAASLSTAAWTQTTTVSVTNDPHLVQLPMPETATRFWRLREN